jgi:hypothetical protein
MAVRKRNGSSSSSKDFILLIILIIIPINYNENFSLSRLIKGMIFSIINLSKSY